jgi:hypothetical protein
VLFRINQSPRLKSWAVEPPRGLKEGLVSEQTENVARAIDKELNASHDMQGDDGHEMQDSCEGRFACIVSMSYGRKLQWKESR